MEYIIGAYIATLLIVVLMELIDRRNELSDIENEYTTLARYYNNLRKVNKDLEESITAYKGWTTKYREDIENLEKKIDESKVLSEALLTKVKKSEMESAKELVKNYYQM